MKSGIEIEKIWFDDDVIELSVQVSDGTSVFVNKVYIGTGVLEDLIKDLNIFREHVHGGLYDIKFGEFGPEYANGRFLARLHFHLPGKLYISTYQQSDFEDFSENSVASEAKFYLKTEPVLFDNFINQLKSLNSGANDRAVLEGV